MLTSESTSISPRMLWLPFIGQVPMKFRGAILQKELEWSTNMLRGILMLWTVWFFGLALFSDTQKATEFRTPYLLIRFSVIILSLSAQIYMKTRNISRTGIAVCTSGFAVLYLGAYLSFSFYSLPLRTTWVTVLPAAFLLATPRSGRAAILSYMLLIASGLILFRQPINTIWVISDILFGLVLIGAGLIIKVLWIKSIVLMLAQEESQRTAMQNEISILEAVEAFIPKGIRRKIRSGLARGSNISDVIRELAKPTEQTVAVLYSDYRNYSLQSASILFVENELILSSQKIIDFAEEQNAIVQTRGDSVLAAFLGETPSVLVVRALLSGILSAKSEFERITLLSKASPDRYMIVTAGNAVFCSLGNEARQEITIAGRPANLAARLDEITKLDIVKIALDSEPTVIFDFQAKTYLTSLALELVFEEIDLRNARIEVRTYTEEKRIFLMRYSEYNLSLLVNFLKDRQGKKETA